ncbi:MAG: hypothetical protein KA314_28390 [Chloroflexi bacterium]|nr:hypothetical protein [Chloroflexota bacterium]MBP8059775.1 hypothetical protein [Chloroflexota bacterium]
MLERFIDSLQNAVVGLGNDLLELVVKTIIMVIVIAVIFGLVSLLAS